METLIGPVVAIVISLGYTEARQRKCRSAQAAHIEEYKALVERVDGFETNLGRNMLGAMVPMSKSIKELQEETVGLR